MKFPANAQQGFTELLGANLAQKMGVRTTQPQHIVIQGKPAIASELQDLKAVPWNTIAMASLSSEQRIDLAKMYYIAAATKNWDVLGLDSSNIMKSVSGDLVQMDTGGSFEFRAQGKTKSYGEDVESELTNFMDPKFASGKAFSALRKYDPAAFKIARGQLAQIPATDYDQVFANSAVSNAEQLKETFKIRLTKVLASNVNPTPTPQVGTLKVPAAKKHLVPLTPEQIAKLRTGARVKYQMRVAHEQDGYDASEIITTVIKCPPPPITPKNNAVLGEYVDSSGGINGSLRSAKGDVSKVDAYYKEKIETLDEMMRNARDYSITMEVTRGVPQHAIQGLGVGDTFIDHGFSSTSFSRQKAKSFGQGAHLEVRLPQGFKFLSVPSFAKAGGLKGAHGLAMGEAEAILPRGCGFKIREIKNEGHKVYYVDAIFSSIQPPREKWVSSLTEKREAKKKLASTASPAPQEPPQ